MFRTPCHTYLRTLQHAYAALLTSIFAEVETGTSALGKGKAPQQRILQTAVADLGGHSGRWRYSRPRNP